MPPPRAPRDAPRLDGPGPPWGGSRPTFARIRNPVPQSGRWPSWGLRPGPGSVHGGLTAPVRMSLTARLRSVREAPRRPSMTGREASPQALRWPSRRRPHPLSDQAGSKPASRPASRPTAPPRRSLPPPSQHCCAPRQHSTALPHTAPATSLLAPAHAGLASIVSPPIDTPSEERSRDVDRAFDPRAERFRPVGSRRVGAQWGRAVARDAFARDAFARDAVALGAVEVCDAASAPRLLHLLTRPVAAQVRSDQPLLQRDARNVQRGSRPLDRGIARPGVPSLSNHPPVSSNSPTAACAAANSALARALCASSTGLTRVAA